MQNVIPVTRFTRRSAQRAGGFMLTLLTVLLFFTACKNKCDNGSFALLQILPAANITGDEVFIVATGVSSNTTVRFDEVEANVKLAEGGLIATVPSGLAGPVTLSIEDGDCKDSKPFEVWSTFPGNIPTSPTNIVIPQTPGGYPGDITNPWLNVFDEEHSIFLNDPFDQFGQLSSDSEERHASNPFLQGNPITGFLDTLTNTVFLVIDRTGKTGGYRDTLNGQFIPNLPKKPNAVSTILLVSKRTGRQLAIYK